MKPNPCRRRSWVTKENIKYWREAAEKYAQENYDLSHRGNFSIERIGTFTDIWFNQDWTKVTDRGRPSRSTLVYQSEVYSLGTGFPHLIGKKERPTKEHYILIDENFKVIKEPGILQSSYKIPNQKIKKMKKVGAIKHQTDADILQTKILLMSGE